MVSIENKQFLIDGKPQIILSGEIHYYRLDKRDWQDRIDKLKAAGLNAVASYIPWICHEEIEGEFDVNGSVQENLDVIGFIDLCKANDLYFIARPGPFIMAEMKNEGIPFWVAEKCPKLKPTGWDGREATTGTLDYLAPDFITYVDRWYANIMPILGERLYDNGGNIIAVQLDNEIGMLSWVSNTPDLTDVVAEHFAQWIKTIYPEDILADRYPFSFDASVDLKQKLQQPQDSYTQAFHRDLGYYMRYRTLVYVNTLKDMANHYGVKDLPFLINIHGTGGGRGFTYPIGISQLYEAYTQSDEFIYGSDIYLGSLTMDNFHDLYLINGYMEAVGRNNQPLTSLEFECGDGNYGETFGSRTDVSAVDFKIRMCIAQGNRLLNCYIFCGGRNELLRKPYHDGNDRVAITGERHGFAAPVSPEGKLNYTYPRMARSLKTMAAVADKLSVMEEERDSIAFTFIPDYYMTEYCYPESKSIRSMHEDLRRFRADISFDRLGRAVLLENYRFTSINPQDKEIPSDQVKTLVIFSASYMDQKVQKKIADFLNNGGGVLLYGRVPEYDMEGNACTILQEAIGIKEVYTEPWREHHWLSVTMQGYMNDFAEVRVSQAQGYDVNDAEVLMTITGTQRICSFEKKVGKGKVIVIGTEYICNPKATTRMINNLGTTAMLTHDCEEHGIFMTMMKGKDQERFLHILNLDGFEKHAKIEYEGKPLFEGKELLLQSKDGLMLPMNMEMDGKLIQSSTAEIYERSNQKWILRLTQECDEIILRGTNLVMESSEYSIEEKNGYTYIRSLLNGKLHTFMTLDFN